MIELILKADKAALSAALPGLKARFPALAPLVGVAGMNGALSLDVEIEGAGVVRATLELTATPDG